jgi:hypothetical protein
MEEVKERSEKAMRYNQEPKPLGGNVFSQRRQEPHGLIEGFPLFGPGQVKLELNAGQSWALFLRLLADIEGLAQATGNAMNSSALEKAAQFALLHDRVMEAIELRRANAYDMLVSAEFDYDLLMQIFERGTQAAQTIEQEVATWADFLEEVRQDLDEAAMIQGIKDVGEPAE